MATTVGRTPSMPQVRSLFRSLIRTANRFPDYNIREYVKRRTAEGFKQNQLLTDRTAIVLAFLDGKSQLELTARQAMVYSLLAPTVKSIMDPVTTKP